MLALPLAACAMVFHSTGDPTYHTNAPGGALTDSGWQYIGLFAQTVGTAIAPHHFIVSKHFNGNVGDPYLYRGETYTTTARIDLPGNDLTLFRVDRPLPAYAPLWTRTDEAGKTATLFGRGVDRGSVVISTNLTGGVRTNGWRWGTTAGVLRWGQNVVEGATTLDGMPMLEGEFNLTGLGTNECMLTGNDSGGPAFLNEGGVWKVAGLGYAVGPSRFSYSADGSNAFDAALYDYRYLYYEENEMWTGPIMTGPARPCSFYLSRISTSFAAITNAIPDFDLDVDGLPDYWERRYTNDVVSLLPGADLDGDGASNLAEFVADTDPTNGASFFRLTGLGGPTADTVEFPGSTGRLYRAEVNDAAGLSGEDWTPDAGGWRAGQGDPTAIAVTNPPPAAPRRAYRVEVRVP